MDINRFARTILFWIDINNILNFIYFKFFDPKHGLAAMAGLTVPVQNRQNCRFLYFKLVRCSEKILVV